MYLPSCFVFSGGIRSFLRGSFRYGMMRLGHNIAGPQRNHPVGVIYPCRLWIPVYYQRLTGSGVKGREALRVRNSVISVLALVRRWRRLKI